jgi:hypothetical protein
MLLKNIWNDSFWPSWAKDKMRDTGWESSLKACRLLPEIWTCSMIILPDPADISSVEALRFTGVVAPVRDAARRMAGGRFCAGARF